MIMRGTHFIFIFHLLTVISTSIAVTRNTRHANVWQRFNTTYNRRRSEQDDFCNANLEKKTAVCDLILREIREDYGVFLNENAIFRNWIGCVEKGVIADESMVPKVQRMFPCYGRHNPTLSGWGLDDYFEYIYISGGPDPNSVFLYKRTLGVDNDYYWTWEIISDIDLSTLQPITITEHRAADELKLLEHVAIMYNKRTIEISFIRNIIKGEYAYPSTFSICQLSREKKLGACKLVIQQIESVDEDFSYELLDDMFESLSVGCDDKKIKFVFDIPDSVVKRKMFPCYGTIPNSTSITRLQLSDGYYQKTILAFVTDDDDNYKFQASIHNINFDSI